MSKKLQSSPKMLAALAKATDNSVQFSDVAVFETISLNTLPLNKRGLFAKATVTENTLSQMADYVNAGGAVPLHTLHQQGYELPIGKTFSAEVFKDSSGISQLRTQFYLPNSRAELISDLELDVINEVSVGLSTTHMNCSSCGWDYRGEDATMMNLFDQTCANDHVIGVDGVHLILNGLDQFLEQSLVSLGAANGAKIQSRTKALMGAESYSKLAASGISPEITVLHATQSMKQKEENNMDIQVLIASLTDVKASEQILKGQFATSQAEVVTLKASLETANASVATANARITPEMTVMAASLETANASAKAAVAYIATEANRLAVALNLEAPAADATMEVLVASIDANRIKMSSAFPVGGVLNSAKVTAPVAYAATNSFKGA